MPKWTMLRKTCSIAWVWTSPPGVPNGIAQPPGLIASAGLGVRRGRLPGATPDGCAGSAQDWLPREDGVRPRPGMVGALAGVSLGVAEKTLPQRSTTQQ